MAINVPMLVGLSVLSDLAVQLLFGARWLPAAPVLALLALTGAAIPLAGVLMQAILAQGSSRAYLHLAIAKQSFGLAAAVVGSLFGIMGLAYAALVAAIAGFLMNGFMAKRLFDYGPLAQLKDLAGIIAAAASMAAFLLALRMLLDLPPLLEACAAVAAGAGFYLGFAMLFRVQAVTETIPMVLGLLSPVLRRLRRRPG
jgi:O-antigen/teichoic acid export membrane protein